MSSIKTRNNLGTNFLQRLSTRLTHRITPEAASKLFLDSSSSLSCPLVTRVGSEEDGGWNICETDIPPPESPCVVYSIGINDDSSFDQDFIKRWPHCEIHAFDPSIGRSTGDNFLGPGISFYNIGLGGKDGIITPSKKKSPKSVIPSHSKVKWEMLTLRSIMEKLGHKHVDVLKIDVEGSEGEAWGEWGVSGEGVGYVGQLVAEVSLFLEKEGCKKRRAFI